LSRKSVVVTLLIFNNISSNIFSLLLIVIIFLTFIFALAKSFSKHTNLYKHLGKNNSINGILFSLIGFPLYFIFYFIQKKQIKKDLNAVEFNNYSTSEAIKKPESTEKTINKTFNKKTKLLFKSSIGTLILAAILVVLYFIFANNKLPEYALAAIQLSVVSSIVSLFYYVNYHNEKKQVLKSSAAFKNTFQKNNSATKDATLNTTKQINNTLVKLSIGTLILSAILVILHFVFANNNLAQYASALLQLGLISLIVSIFYFIKYKLK